jgi:hypothetical protein
MRILIDECVDPRIKTLFSGHDACTVHEMGWDRLQDGPLIELAERLIVIRVPKNQMRFYLPLKPQLLEAISSAQPGRVVVVGYQSSVS